MKLIHKINALTVQIPRHTNAQVVNESQDPRIAREK